jgi:hypothetical protein
LQATSKDILEIGEIGQATAIKVATNMITAATVQAAAEAMALVQAAGLSPEKFSTAMQQNASYSKTLAMKLPKMIEQNFERHFSVQHMLKDMQIANRLGLTHHLELAVTAAARDRLLEQVQRGHGDEDYSAVARKYIQESAPRATEAELELFQRRTAQTVTPTAPQKPDEAKAVPIDAPKPVAIEAPISPQPQPVQTTPAPPAIAEQPKVPEPVAEAPVASTVEKIEQPKPEPVLVAAERVESAAETTQPPDQAIKTAPENISTSGSALEALQAHAPAAPFLNPVHSAESEPDTSEQTEQNVPVQTAPDFLSEARQQAGEDEGTQARGFFSRLLRRANS